MNPFAPTLPLPPELSTTLFPPTSRYHGLGVQKLTRPNGAQVAYVARRFVPHPERFETLQEHLVVEGDRPDNLAAQYLSDPEQFWHLADANYDLNPFELTETINRRLRITLPEGIPAMPVLS